MNMMIKQSYFISCLTMETIKAPHLCFVCLHIFTSMVSCSVKYLCLYNLIHKYEQIKIKKLNMFESQDSELPVWWQSSYTASNSFFSCRHKRSFTIKELFCIACSLHNETPNKLLDIVNLVYYRNICFYSILLVCHYCIMYITSSLFSKNMIRLNCNWMPTGSIMYIMSFTHYQTAVTKSIWKSTHFRLQAPTVTVSDTFQLPRLSVVML